jgi:plastocyanin
MKNLIIVAAIILAAGLGVWLLVSQNSTQSQAAFENFIISAQDTGSTVTIDRVELGSPGFIVLREVVNGKSGQIVEVSPYLPSGVHENITISLSAPLAEEGQVDISGALPVSVETVAVVYSDDGDAGFNPTLDAPQYVNGKLVARYLSSGEVAPNSVVPQGSNAAGTENAAAIVTYTDEGFVPNEVTISLGETVTFVNESSKPMWVASNVHPAHTILPTFDQFMTSAVGESYSYTFDQAGEWEYHDHVNARQLGVVIVK